MKKLTVIVFLLYSSVCLAGPPASPKNGGDRHFDDIEIRSTLSYSITMTQTNVESLITECTGTGHTLDLGGATLTLTSTIDVPVGVFTLKNVTFDGSGLSSGYAVRFVPSASDTNNAVYPMANIKVIGPDTDGTTVDGVYIGRTGASGNTAAVTFDNLDIDGFRDNLVLGNYTWANKFRNIRIHDFHRYGINAALATSAGEMMTFFGGVIYDGENSGSTAIGLYAPSGSNGDFALYGIAFDYNDQDFYIIDGSYLFSGCHFEDDNSDIIGAIETDSTQIVVSFVGGKISPTVTKSIWFTTTGDNISLDFTDVYLYTYDNADNTEIVDVVSGDPVIAWHNPHLICDNGESPRISSYSNLIGNNGFETSDTTYWTVNNSGNVTHSVDAVEKHSGSYSLKAVGSDGSAGGSTTQIINCAHFRNVLVSAWLKTDLSSNYITVLVKFYSQDSTQISSNDFSSQHVTGTTDWTRVSGKFRVPPHAYFASVQLYSYNTVGDAWFDDLEVWLY